MKEEEDDKGMKKWQELVRKEKEWQEYSYKEVLLSKLKASGKELDPRWFRKKPRLFRTPTGLSGKPGSRMGWSNN